MEPRTMYIVFEDQNTVAIKNGGKVFQTIFKFDL